MTIVATGSISGFFHEVVEDAIKARRVDVTDGTTTYLVSLLADFARPDVRAEATLERPLTFLLDEALHTPEPAERFERLRTLGDGVLYSCGFFADHYEARGLDPRYIHGIGTTAYGTASSMLHASADDAPFDIFRELASKFDSLVQVIAEVADFTVARGASLGSRGLLKIYERWLRTGSERLAQELSSQGLVPTRGPKGTLQ